MRTRRTHRHAPLDQPKYISNFSAAPFAGVWLIIGLLAMGAYGIKPHAITVDLPQPYPPGYVEPLSPPINLLSIDAASQITWNGEPIEAAELPPILQQVKEANPQPALHFAPTADASYGGTMRLLRTVSVAGLVDACFVFPDVWRYRRFESAEPDLSPQPHSRHTCNVSYDYLPLSSTNSESRSSTRMAAPASVSASSSNSSS